MSPEWIADGCAEAQRHVERGMPTEAARVLDWMAREVRRKHGRSNRGRLHDGSRTDRVLGVLELMPEGVTSKAIQHALDLDWIQVAGACRELVKMGHVERVRPGFFKARGKA